ncbi:MAG: hypothetical protein ABJA49_15190, partial [Betaproteobacteria bacterium]
MAAIEQGQAGQVDIELRQQKIADRTFGQVVLDPTVAELLGGLTLDRHPDVVHAGFSLVWRGNCSSFCGATRVFKRAAATTPRRAGPGRPRPG